VVRISEDLVFGPIVLGPELRKNLMRFGPVAIAAGVFHVKQDAR